MKSPSKHACSDFVTCLFWFCYTPVGRFINTPRCTSKLLVTIVVLLTTFSFNHWSVCPTLVIETFACPDVGLLLDFLCCSYYSDVVLNRDVSLIVWLIRIKFSSFLLQDEPLPSSFHGKSPVLILLLLILLI